MTPRALPAKTDVHLMAELLVNCWGGAALRSRLRRDPAQLGDMLDFYFLAASHTRSIRPADE